MDELFKSLGDAAESLQRSVASEIQKQSEVLAHEYDRCASTPTASAPSLSRFGDLSAFSPAAFTNEALHSVSSRLAETIRFPGEGEHTGNDDTTPPSCGLGSAHPSLRSSGMEEDEEHVAAEVSLAEAVEPEAAIPAVAHVVEPGPLAELAESSVGTAARNVELALEERLSWPAAEVCNTRHHTSVEDTRSPLSTTVVAQSRSACVPLASQVTADSPLVGGVNAYDGREVDDEGCEEGSTVPVRKLEDVAQTTSSAWVVSEPVVVAIGTEGIANTPQRSRTEAGGSSGVSEGGPCDSSPDEPELLGSPPDHFQGTLPESNRPFQLGDTLFEGGMAPDDENVGPLLRGGAVPAFRGEELSSSDYLESCGLAPPLAAALAATIRKGDQAGLRLEILEQQNEELRRRNNELQYRKGELEAQQRDDAATAISGWERGADSLLIADVTAAIEAAESRARSAQTEAARFNEERTALYHHNSELKAELNRISSMAKNKDEAVTAERKALNEAAMQLAALDATWRSEMSQLEATTAGELARVDRQRAEAETARAQAEARLAQLRISVEAEIASAVKRAVADFQSASAATAASATTKVERAEARAVEAEARAADAEAEALSARAAVGEVTEDVKGLSEAATYVDDCHSAREAELKEALQASLNELTSVRTHLEAELEAARSALALAAVDTENRLARSFDEVERMRAAAEVAEAARDQLFEEAHKLQREAAALREAARSREAERAKAEAAAATAVETAAAALIEKEQLYSEAATLQAEVARLRRAVPPLGSAAGAAAVRAALGGGDNVAESVSIMGTVEAGASPAVGSSGTSTGRRDGGGGLDAEKYRYLRQVTINFLEAPEEMQHELWPPIAAVLELSPEEVNRIGTARLVQRSCSLSLVLDILTDPTALAVTHPKVHAALTTAARSLAAGAATLPALATQALAAAVDAAPGAIANVTAALHRVRNHGGSGGSGTSQERPPNTAGVPQPDVV